MGRPRWPRDLRIQIIHGLIPCQLTKTSKKQIPFCTSYWSHPRSLADHSRLYSHCIPIFLALCHSHSLAVKSCHLTSPHFTAEAYYCSGNRAGETPTYNSRASADKRLGVSFKSRHTALGGVWWKIGVISSSDYYLQGSPEFCFDLGSAGVMSILSCFGEL